MLMLKKQYNIKKEFFGVYKNNKIQRRKYFTSNESYPFNV